MSLYKHLRNEVESLTAEGQDVSGIAEHLGVSRSYVRYVQSTHAPCHGNEDTDVITLPTEERPKHKGHRPTLNTKDVERIVELDGAGFTLRAIARVFGVTPRTISYHLNKEVR